MKKTVLIVGLITFGEINKRDCITKNLYNITKDFSREQ